jgi:hypothetical protein
MKQALILISKLTTAALAACVIASAVAAQTQALQAAGRLRIESLDRLKPKAVESVNVNLGEQLLRIVPWKKGDPDEENVAQMIAGLKGVYVRHYEFEREGAYAESDIEPLRAQLRGPGWTQIVEVTSRREDFDNLEVYLATTEGRVDGLVVISVDPKRITLVNIVGAVDLDKLRKLEGSFGIPELEIERDNSKAPKKKGADAPAKKP